MDGSVGSLCRLTALVPYTSQCEMAVAHHGRQRCKCFCVGIAASRDGISTHTRPETPSHSCSTDVVVAHGVPKRGGSLPGACFVGLIANSRRVASFANPGFSFMNVLSRDTGSLRKSLMVNDFLVMMGCRSTFQDKCCSHVPLDQYCALRCGEASP
jgi:hypothetical protein